MLQFAPIPPSLPAETPSCIFDYCGIDVLNTYRVWLRYELFRDRLTPVQFAESEANLPAYIKERADAKPHLAEFTSRDTPKTIIVSPDCPAAGP